MAADIENVDIGACSLTLGSVDLGHTIGGVEVSITRETVELKVDQYGGVVDRSNLNEEVTITVNLAESDLVKLKESFPLTKASSSSSRIPFGSEAGTLYRSLAAKLTCHPLNRGVDTSADIVVPKAIAHSDFTYSYSKEDQKVYAVTFTGLIDANGIIAYLGSSPT